MYTMKESVAVAKQADAKKGVSPTRSDNSILRPRNVPERQLDSLRGVIGNIRRDGGTPSVESIATQLSGMPTGGRAPALLALQRTHGNRYVQRVVAGIQAKLVVGQPGDIYEQEADRVADEVMRMPEPQVQPTPTHPLSQGPSCGDEDMEGELIQTRPISEKITPIVQRKKEPQEQAQEITPEQDSRIQSLRGGGKLLPESTRAFFEPRFGHDFSNVRVHTGVNATKIAESIYARAFTLGNNIVFGHGQYSTGTDKGRRLLGHELTHVIQQDKSGFVSGNSHGPICEVSKMRTESIQRDIEPYPGILGDFIIRVVNPEINVASAFIEQVSKDLATKVGREHVSNLMVIDRFHDRLEICWNEVFSLQRPGTRQIIVRLEGWGGRVSRFILITPQVEIPEESRGQSESRLPALEESPPVTAPEPVPTRPTPPGSTPTSTPTPAPTPTPGQEALGSLAEGLETFGGFTSARWLWNPINEQIAEWEGELDRAGEQGAPDTFSQVVLIPIAVLFTILQVIVGTLDLIARLNLLNVELQRQAIQIRALSGQYSRDDLIRGATELGDDALDIITLGIRGAINHLQEGIEEGNAFRITQAVSEFALAALALFGIGRIIRARLRARGAGTAPAPARPGEAPVTAARPPSEVTTLTNVQPEILARDVLPQYNIGSGFSGVYNPVTRQWVALASGESTSLVSGQSIRTVGQLGGHLAAEAELVARTGFADVSRNVGFVIIREAGNTLRIRWNSGQINLRNFGDRAAPSSVRADILDAVQGCTGVEVR
jgi:hypothetical protein